MKGGPRVALFNCAKIAQLQFPQDSIALQISQLAHCCFRKSPYNSQRSDFGELAAVHVIFTSFGQA
jgi:hypothetical protein